MATDSRPSTDFPDWCKQEGLLDSPLESADVHKLALGMEQGQSSGGAQKLAEAKPKPALAPKKGASKGKKACRGCCKLWPTEKFAVNTPYCPECNPVMKRLQRLAKSQKAEETLKEIKGDLDRLRRLIAHYREKVPQSGADRGRKDGFKFVEFKQVEEASSQVLKDRRGKMMHEARYIEYATSIKGGSYTWLEAKGKWDAMFSDSEHPRDYDGPDHSRLQLLVSTSTVMTQREAYKRSKVIEMSERQKYTEENLAKARRGLTSGHEEIDNSQDTLQQMYSALATASGPAFENEVLVSGSLTTLEEEARQKEPPLLLVLRRGATSLLCGQSPNFKRQTVEILNASATPSRTSKAPSL